METEKSKNKTTIIYNDWNETTFKYLSDEQLGILIRALVLKNIDEETTIPPSIENDITLLIAYKQLENIILMEKHKYEEKCKKNKENILKRYEQKTEGKVW